MAVPSKDILVGTEAEVRALGVRHPALFLSASVPAVRLTAPPHVQRRDQEHVATAHPDRIREAVRWVCHYAFGEGLQIVFGGHPAISPMVLAAARDIPVTNTGPRVWIYQSEAFRSLIPRASLDLGDWSAGQLVWTPASQPPGEALSWEGRETSLLRMRQLMISTPSLVGAIFIGGLSGVEEESRLFAERWPKLPRYAIGSTGGATAGLLQADPDGHRGGLAVHRLADDLDYAGIVWDIFDDLERRGAIPEAPSSS